MRENIEAVIKDLKLRLKYCEEYGVVRIPKDIVEEMIERLEALHEQEYP